MKNFLVILLFLSQGVWASPRLVVEPKEGLLDEALQVQVVEAPPKSRVKVMAMMQDEGGRVWKSHAVFLSDEKGGVDLTRARPLEGTYEGVDPMGLFWSMALEKGEKDCTLFIHKGLAPIEVAMAAHLEDGTVVFNKVARKVVKEGVKRERITEGGIVGNLFLPQGAGPFPAVIVLGGAGGGIPFDSYVAQFANAGYAAFGLAYFFAPGLPQHMNNIPLEIIDKAISWLKKQQKIDTTHLAVVGASMGGVYGLLGASYYPAIKAVVVLDGAGIVFQSLDSGKKLNIPVSPFSFEEKPLSFLPLTIPQLDEENLKTCFFLRTFLGSYFDQPKDKIEETSVKVEKINGPILLLGTLDDQLFGSANLLEQAYNRLVAHHFPHEYDLVVYKGAGHMLGIYGLPHTPTTSSCMQLRQNKMIFNLGGNPRDMTKAQSDSWKRTFAFLKKHLYNSTLQLF